MSTTFILHALVYLAAAVISVPVARRLGLGSALGYLLAGVVIGPFMLGLVGEEGQDVLHFAEFGVVLMLFLVGMELRPRVLWRMRAPIIGMGGLQMTVTAAAIGAICVAFGMDWRTGAAVGLIVAMSSTAIVLQTLEEKGWLKAAAGRRAFSVLLFQDIAVIPILALLPLLAPAGLEAVSGAGHGAGHPGRPGWMQALLVVGVVTVIVLGGRYLSRPVFNYIARTRSQEMFMATSLLLVFVITQGMNYVGLSPALGTFLAGVVLAESEYRHELEANIEPFKGLLLGLFFIAVGAGIDLRLVAAEPLMIAGAVVALIAVKFAVLYGLGRLFRMATGDRLLFAFALAQGGEFAFLLASFALQNRVLDQETVNLLIAVVVLSMAVTPVLIIVFEKLIQPRLAASGGGDPDVEEPDGEDNPVIIAGYGRFGQVVSRLLRASGFEATLLDHDAGQIEFVGRFGSKVFYGDASRTDLLTAAGANWAKVLVVAIDHREKAVRMVEVAKKAFPHLKVLTRAIDRPHAYQLMQAGADYIARETFGSAVAVGESALRMLGIPDARARRAAEKFEDHDTEGLYKLYEHWGDADRYGSLLQENLAQLRQVLRDDLEHPVDDQPKD